MQVGDDKRAHWRANPRLSRVPFERRPGPHPSHLLDPAVAGEAGALHGQLTGKLPSGALALACSKPVEENVRAQLLIVPGLVRIDVLRREENLAVIPRNISGYEANHTFDALTRGGYRNQDAEQPVEGLAPVEVWAVFNTPGEPTFFLGLVTCVSDEDLYCHHFMGKGEVWAQSQNHRNVTLVP